MHTILKSAVTAATMILCAQAAAEVVLYERENFDGRSYTATAEVRNLESGRYLDGASSAVVVNGEWQVCENERSAGKCMVLRPGNYPSRAAMGLSGPVSSVRAISGTGQLAEYRYAPRPNAEGPGVVAPLITFYENESFEGRSFNTAEPVGNFERFGFNNRASSVVVIGQRWEVCENPGFGGRCMVLRQGRYPSLTAMGLNDRASSVRLVAGNARIDDSRYAPAPLAVYDNRRRRNERVYEANVSSVRAVVGTPEQRCWIEKEAIPQNPNSLSIPGTLIGAVIGGVLGHQIGSGSGNTIATIGGAVAGGAAGSQIGRLGIGGQAQQTRDVQRCDTVASDAKPDHWDVTYDFRGQEHRIQMTTPPGPTITVNERGEPRA